jgi:hypothetical protein
MLCLACPDAVIHGVWLTLRLDLTVRLFSTSCNTTNTYTPALRLAWLWPRLDSPPAVQTWRGGGVLPGGVRRARIERRDCHSYWKRHRHEFEFPPLFYYAGFEMGKVRFRHGHVGSRCNMIEFISGLLVLLVGNQQHSAQHHPTPHGTMGHCLLQFDCCLY